MCISEHTPLDGKWWMLFWLLLNNKKRLITTVCFRFRPRFFDELPVSSAAKFSEPMAEVQGGSTSSGMRFDFIVELSFTPTVSE